MLTFQLSEDEASVILSMRENSKNKRFRNLSRGISLLTSANYFANPRILLDAFNNRLMENGFNAVNFSEVCSSDEGQKNFHVGQDVWVHISWFLMPSGKTWEIVAYVN